DCPRRNAFGGGNGIRRCPQRPRRRETVRLQNVRRPIRWVKKLHGHDHIAVDISGGHHFPFWGPPVPIRPSSPLPFACATVPPLPDFLFHRFLYVRAVTVCNELFGPRSPPRRLGVNERRLLLGGVRHLVAFAPRQRREHGQPRRSDTDEKEPGETSGGNTDFP